VRGSNLECITCIEIDRVANPKNKDFMMKGPTFMPEEDVF